MPNLEGLKKIVDRTRSPRLEMGMAMLEIQEKYSDLMKLIKIDEMCEDTPKHLNLEAECFLDLIDAYLTTSKREIKGRLDSFAENYQMNPSEVEKVLEYLGLEI